MSFAENLMRARKLAHLSQQQLAQRSNVSQQAISKLESGKSSPSEYTIKLLAAALRMPAADLISDDKKIPIAESDGLMQEIITRIQYLPDPALTRLSDFLDGMTAGQEISAQPAAGHSSAAEPDD